MISMGKCINRRMKVTYHEDSRGRVAPGPPPIGAKFLVQHEVNIGCDVFVAVNPGNGDALTDGNEDEGSATAVFIHHLEHILSSLPAINQTRELSIQQCPPLPIPSLDAYEGNLHLLGSTHPRNERQAEDETTNSCGDCERHLVTTKHRNGVGDSGQEVFQKCELEVGSID